MARRREGSLLTERGGTLARVMGRKKRTHDFDCITLLLSYSVHCNTFLYVYLHSHEFGVIIVWLKVRKVVP